ncbi:MFS general substrate transporter [Sistotremastrum niveocremeum HHB9708]|uniref:MFS general substrate transporter n=1 Tax=Sistotremastrum niveocremeum HHB9708 TaxID=1314777 RepID=A0A164NKX6_9AGAM|nr:MFS general substrate transporter [Sistotremastrum niveocremeum HHB9708]
MMMEDLHVTDKPSDIGYYSGAVDSIFAVCQLFTVLQWGRLSDRIGRKPVLLFGLTGVALSTSLFGLSRSLIWAICARSLAGALSGNAAVVQSMISEITDETNQGQAFPLTGLAWSLGCIFGPMIGGNFVDPAKRFPTTIGTIPVFANNPYLLPCVVSASLTMCSITFGIFFLKETLPSKIAVNEKSAHRLSFGRENEKLPQKQVSIKYILASPIIKSVFKNYFLLSALGTSTDVVFILMAYTPVRLGGLSRTPEEIGYALAFSGMAGGIIQVLIFPVLQRKYKNIPLYRALMSLWPLIFALLPFINIIARMTLPAEALLDDDLRFPASPLVWMSIGVVLSVFRMASMSYSLNVILIKNAAPSQEALGSTFGLSQSVACIARAASPAFVSSIFAVSKKYQILGGNFVWLAMFGIGLLALWSTYQVVDGAEERERMKEERNMF